MTKRINAFISMFAGVGLLFIAPVIYAQQQPPPPPPPLACTNPSPIPQGFVAPCPVFSVASPSSGGTQATVSLNALSGATAHYIYTKVYVSKLTMETCPAGTTASPDGNWCQATLQLTTGSYESGSTDYVARNTSAVAALSVAGFTVGQHWVALWDWNWNPNLTISGGSTSTGCYMGPGGTGCYISVSSMGGASWRIQPVTVPTGTAPMPTPTPTPSPTQSPCDKYLAEFDRCKQDPGYIAYYSSGSTCINDKSFVPASCPSTAGTLCGDYLYILPWTGSAQIPSNVDCSQYKRQWHVYCSYSNQAEAVQCGMPWSGANPFSGGATCWEAVGNSQSCGFREGCAVSLTANADCPTY